MNTRSIGTYYESVAVKYLEGLGYKILERNFRCKTGEIDIIAKDGKYIVFTEVKYRKNTLSGYAREAVGIKKQKTIYRCALYYLSKNGLSEYDCCRFDVIAICKDSLHHIKNAFGGL